ncbi:MAG: polymer-forming cytoskeletal protein [Bacillota bacterium]|nr:polymer-forming cytoskeletal protein [Bacillota bacterium]
MGFFSDLKDDLSQAVNELMPEEGKEEVKAEETAAPAAKGGIPEMGADLDMDLSRMLDNMEVEEPMKEEQLYVAPVAEKISSEPKGTASKKISDEVSVLTESMIINGNLATEGSLDVRGSIVGNVEALGKMNITGAIQGNSQAAEIYAEGAKITGDLRSEGSIKVGQSTVIIGNVFATSAVIAGAIKGDIDVRGPVILDASAIVMGDIKSKSVQINNGAVIEGMCSQCYAEVNPTSFFEELKKMK